MRLNPSLAAAVTRPGVEAERTPSARTRAGYTREKGCSYLRINTRSGVLPTACRLPQQSSSTMPRAWSITVVRHTRFDPNSVRLPSAISLARRKPR